MTNKNYKTIPITKAAKLVGLSRNTLWRRIKELNISLTTDLLDKRVKRVKLSDLEKMVDVAERIRNGELTDREVKKEFSKRKAARS